MAFFILISPPFFPPHYYQALSCNFSIRGATLFRLVQATVRTQQVHIGLTLFIMLSLIISFTNIIYGYLRSNTYAYAVILAICT